MNSIFLMYVPPFLPYFAFALIVVAGCWTKNNVAIWAGIIFMFLYDAKPKMEIIARRFVGYSVRDRIRIFSAGILKSSRLNGTVKMNKFRFVDLF